MHCIVFPKFFQELTVTQLGRELSGLGFDGVDVMVRDGYWTTRENLTRTLDVFVRAMDDFGLSAENATTDFLDPDEPDVESAVAALAENGIRQFRLKHIPYEGAKSYRGALDTARRQMERWERIGEKHGARAFLQTHGGSIHPSASSAARIVEGFDPAYIGVHHDPGNMICQEGYESWEIGFDILGGHLCMLGVKNAGLFRSADGRWRRRWTALSEGAVDYRQALLELRRTRFSGPLCMHNFYGGGLERLREKTRADLRHLRNVLEEVGLA